MLENDRLNKIAEKAVKQPKIALRMLRRLPTRLMRAESAIKEYDLNRGTQAEQVSLENLRAAIGGE